jgi:hypothetical protein
MHTRAHAPPPGPDDPALIRYEAESPDEAALVVAAKVFGFFFFKRTNTVLVRAPHGVLPLAPPPVEGSGRIAACGRRPASASGPAPRRGMRP